MKEEELNKRNIFLVGSVFFYDEKYLKNAFTLQDSGNSLVLLYAYNVLKGG